MKGAIKMIRRIVGMVAVILMMAASAGYAAEPQGWSFSVMPYAWLAGFQGSMTVAGHTINFDKSWSDISEYVDQGGSVLGNVQYNRFLFFVQEDYVKFQHLSPTVDGGANRGSTQPIVLVSEAGVGYKVDGWMEGQTFDLEVGVRNFHLTNHLDVYNVGIFSNTRNVTDGMFWLRPHVPLFPSDIKGLSLVGGFGIGAGNSKFDYELSPTLRYEFTDSIAGVFGYRRLGWDWNTSSNSNNKINVSMAGLMVGIDVTF